jgi:hypothetical protein
MAEKIFNYKFRTDSVIPVYYLELHMRNIRNEYLIKIFKSSLTEAKKKDAKARNIDPDSLNKLENFLIPKRFYNLVRQTVKKDFKKVREHLEKKHDIRFLTFDVEQVFFYRNPQDVNEWILQVIYKGDYEDD